MTEPNTSERQPPLTPGHIPLPEQPQISEIATLGTIFIEPENTFKDFLRAPRIVIAGIVIALLVTAYSFSLIYKIGEATMRSYITDQINKNPQADSLTAEQKASRVELSMTINKYSRYAVPVFVFISFFVGGLLYWLGGKAFGGTGTYMQNVSVWIYSGLPPALVSVTGSIIVLALKSADDIDLAAGQKGMLHADPSFFIDGKAMPFLATILSTFDVFAIWGWVLAAIGLTVVNKISKGSAWALVSIFVLIGLGFRLLGAYFSGNPT
jgi:hypothetical protein